MLYSYKLYITRGYILYSHINTSIMCQHVIVMYFTLQLYCKVQTSRFDMITDIYCWKIALLFEFIVISSVTESGCNWDVCNSAEVLTFQKNVLLKPLSMCCLFIIFNIIYNSMIFQQIMAQSIQYFSIQIFYKFKHSFCLEFVFL